MLKIVCDMLICKVCRKHEWNMQIIFRLTLAPFLHLSVFDWVVYRIWLAHRAAEHAFSWTFGDISSKLPISAAIINCLCEYWNHCRYNQIDTEKQRTREHFDEQFLLWKVDFSPYSTLVDAVPGRDWQWIHFLRNLMEFRWHRIRTHWCIDVDKSHQSAHSVTACLLLLRVMPNTRATQICRRTALCSFTHFKRHTETTVLMLITANIAKDEKFRCK